VAVVGISPPLRSKGTPASSELSDQFSAPNGPSLSFQSKLRSSPRRSWMLGCSVTTGPR